MHLAQDIAAGTICLTGIKPGDDCLYAESVLYTGDFLQHFTRFDVGVNRRSPFLGFGLTRVIDDGHSLSQSLDCRDKIKCRLEHMTGCHVALGPAPPLSDSLS